MTELRNAEVWPVCQRAIKLISDEDLRRILTEAFSDLYPLPLGETHVARIERIVKEPR